MAKRTKAQRRAAALASWERRRKGLPPTTPQNGKRRRKVKGRMNEVVAAAPQPAEPVVRYIEQPRITYAVKEGNDVFICFGHGGSLNREKVSREQALKLIGDLVAAIR